MGLCLRRLVLQYPRRGGRVRPESVAAFNRNQWQPSPGIGGSIRPESVATFDRNTHLEIGEPPVDPPKFVKTRAPIDRNSKCPCGSGLKFKRCYEARHDGKPPPGKGPMLTVE